MTKDEIRAMERSWAYEHATGVIDVETLTLNVIGAEQLKWHDLASADADIEDEIAYLEVRGLLIRYPMNPYWVAFLDESEATA